MFIAVIVKLVTPLCVELKNIWDCKHFTVRPASLVKVDAFTNKEQFICYSIY